MVRLIFLAIFVVGVIWFIGYARRYGAGLTRNPNDTDSDIGGSDSSSDGSSSD